MNESNWFHYIFVSRFFLARSRSHIIKSKFNRSSIAAYKRLYQCYIMVSVYIVNYIVKLVKLVYI